MEMAKTVLNMSMSLDGFVAGPNETVENGLGDNGMRLHEWIFKGGGLEEADVPGRPDGVDGEIWDELMATGAVIAGRGTVDPADWWSGDHHGVPVYILTHTRTAADVEQWPLLTVTDDVEDAFARAREDAGDREVLVHGVGVGAAALKAGILDELELHLVPVVLGEGRSLFEGLGAEPHDFELVRCLQGQGVTHLRYRVVR
jgi:dihydrofolate reductase